MPKISADKAKFRKEVTHTRSVTGVFFRAAPKKENEKYVVWAVHPSAGRVEGRGYTREEALLEAKQAYARLLVMDVFYLEYLVPCPYRDLSRYEKDLCTATDVLDRKALQGGFVSREEILLLKKLLRFRPQERARFLELEQKEKKLAKLISHICDTFQIPLKEPEDLATKLKVFHSMYERALFQLDKKNLLPVGLWPLTEKTMADNYLHFCEEIRLVSKVDLKKAHALVALARRVSEDHEVLQETPEAQRGPILEKIVGDVKKEGVAVPLKFAEAYVRVLQELGGDLTCEILCETDVGEDERGPYLLISDDGGAGGENVAAALLFALTKWSTNVLRTGFTYATTCSKHRPASFSGGVCLVSRAGVTFRSSRASLESFLEHATL
jgi:hypothetical protein